MPIWVEIFKLGIQNFCQREHPLMMSDLRGDGGGYEIIPNDWTLEGKNRTLGGGGRGVQKSSDIINGRSFPKRKFMNFENWCN